MRGLRLGGGLLMVSLICAITAWSLRPDRVSVPTAARSPFSCTVRTVRADASMESTAEQSLREARSALAEGRLDDALVRCREAVNLAPDSALAYFLLGMIQIKRGDEGAARQALVQSLKLDPAHSATHYYLGKLYLASNDLAGAKTEFEAAVSLGDPSGAAHYSLGLTLLAGTHYAEAIPHLRLGMDRNPQDPERLLALVGAELQLRRTDEARQDAARIRERFPRDPALAYRTGKALLEYSLIDDAEAELERAAGLLTEPGDKPPSSGLNSSDLHLQLARLRFDRHDYTGTLHEFGAVSLAGVADPLRASAMHLEGQALVGVGRASEAVEKLRQASQMNPANPEYLVHLTWAQLLAGDATTAAATAQSAASRWPDVADVRLMQTLLKREAAPARAKVPLSRDWQLKGEGMVCCPCKSPCPCRSNGPPTYGHCENTGLMRIHQGHYGSVSLDGFQFVSFNNEMETRTAPDTLYVEPSATDEQLIALERIMQSFNPLQPSMLVNVERVPILFRASGRDNVYELKIPKLLEMRIRRRLTPAGEPLFAAAALDQFSNRIEYARNLTYKLWDGNGALKWDYSGHQANYRVIDLTSRAYTDQTMLIQFADGSGTFTKKQTDLIQSQKLPSSHAKQN
jgi:Flp pilus assembly protein TadD